MYPCAVSASDLLTIKREADSCRVALEEEQTARFALEETMLDEMQVLALGLGLGFALEETMLDEMQLLRTCS